ncbi:SDR family oxidoreductase [Rhodococcus triatomae]|uniref:Putative NADH-flavin reductase n=1 Tax=Rhodococcus triatomae TaxID=300028 RepID=A0A1G8PFM9_9NOCA|nr:SDR family oxidoreductase [Rhodococcus triatomae]QNG20091.1 SDR family oxidoreductase [Rhodococcus triatomae]QNG23993.1 SDR family oxidoreductase [Rhodococcus triatomae]SDI91361.1 Putative NADH-flavin reductase [Rhodococcus triatomae]
MARVAIIGGHGKIALQLARILTARGDEVTSVIRNPDQAGEVAATGATPVVADVEGLVTDQITDVLRGHDALVWSAGAGGGNPARTYAVDRDAAIRSMDAAARAGIGRYVMISYLGARPDHGVDPENSFFAYAEAKAAADQYLRGTELDWTILGPSTLTSDPGTGTITVDPDAASGTVPREDVARVAAAVLERPQTAGRFIGFIGGDTPIDQALDAPS